MDESREMAEKQVEAFIEILRFRYGLTEADIPEILDTAKWAVKHRSRIDKAIGFAVISIIGLIVAGVAAALWEGLKQLITLRQ